MSNLSEDTVKNLCRLCKIEVEESKLPALFANLKGVLDFADQLHEVDVTNILPYSHMDEQGIDSLRDDEPREPLSRDTFLANAPDQVGGMIRVPTVIRKDA